MNKEKDFERMCIPVTDNNGVYSINPNATEEVWDEIVAIAETTDPIENLQGWGRWERSEQVVIDGREYTYFVE